LRLWDVDAAAAVEPPIGQLRLALAIALVVTAAIIWLGRHKPRLGQSYGPARKLDEPNTESRP
jgi:hypothetical protein